MGYAGYTCLKHILEIKPDIVKLDISLVHAVCHDPARGKVVKDYDWCALRTPQPSCAPAEWAVPSRYSREPPPRHRTSGELRQ